jgi:outer membrane protein TolC
MTALAYTALLATSVVGQMVPQELTLEEAIGLAKSNNPTFLSTQNDQAAAGWQVREAYASFLPTATASGSANYTEAGVQRFGTVTLEDQTTDWYSSSYNLSLNWTLSGNTIFGVSNARANRRAIDARVDAAEFGLESNVAFQYMAVLRAQDGVDVAQRQLDRARQNLQIVNTRVSTGAAAGVEGRQAEVDLGRAEVVLIQAQRDLRQARLMLAEQLGVQLDEDVRLSSAFDVFEPDFDPQELLELALSDHPSLNAYRAQEAASRAQARQTATSQYLPTLFARASWTGFTQQALNEAFVRQSVDDRAASRVASCEFGNTLENGLIGGYQGIQDCSQYAATEEARLAALSANDQFPFNFNKNPLSMSMTLQIPLFTGFSRQRQVSEANNQAEDAAHNRRAEELRLQTSVTNTYDNLVSAYRVVQAEARNRTLAEEQLQLQQRRYALGASGMLLLMDAQTTVTTADQAYLNAVYDFHYNLIALEAAVGKPLRSR